MDGPTQNRPQQVPTFLISSVKTHNASCMPGGSEIGWLTLRLRQLTPISGNKLEIN